MSRAGHIKARTPSSESLHENEPGAVSPPNKLVSDLTFLKKIFSCEIIISCNGNSVVGWMSRWHVCQPTEVPNDSYLIIKKLSFHDFNLVPQLIFFFCCSSVILSLYIQLPLLLIPFSLSVFTGPFPKSLLTSNSPQLLKIKSRTNKQISVPGLFKHTPILFYVDTRNLKNILCYITHLFNSTSSSFQWLLSHL